MLSKTILIVLISVSSMIWLASVGSAGNRGDVSIKEITVFESSTKTLTQSDALLNSGEVHLPTKFLQDAFGLERKVLSEDMIGICLKELCIPFSKSNGSHRLRYEADTEYVPAEQLLTAPNGTMVWDAGSNDLLLNLKPQNTGTNPLGKADSEFALNDISGNRVALSDFKGKKVALFAWASW